MNYVLYREGCYIKDFYVMTNGTKIKRDDNTIILINNESSRKIPCESIENIYLFGETDLNTKFLNFISSKGIILHVFNYYGFYSGSYTPKETNISGKLLLNQALFSSDIEKRIKIAKEILFSASFNILKVIKYYNNRNINLLEEINYIEILRNKLKLTKSINELMGYEGNISRVYYSCFSQIVDNKDFKLEKRIKNPPDNMINSLISFMNSLIYTTFLSEIYKTQLNSTISFLHEPSTKRHSLCLDLAEIFKPILGDRLIFKLLNKSIITSNDFENNSSHLILKDLAKKKIIENYEERLETTIFHRELNKNVSYRHLIKLECYKIVKHLMNDKNYEGFKIWW